MAGMLLAAANSDKELPRPPLPTQPTARIRSNTTIPSRSEELTGLLTGTLGVADRFGRNPQSISAGVLCVFQ